ncbi:HeH/LEM domain-containing protein [Weissella ceti]|uniref:HeH/LEM domain-containing protein n=1 Tax=Weissella ceti TaxID=759620 RepID=A0ABT3E5H6_9LACO|nr:HeH/LEM domain-containing protein [Weissella ceti]MCW0953669.1 HeH/LEM domain-containing protein [Weissella ceti]
METEIQIATEAAAPAAKEEVAAGKPTAKNTVAEIKDYLKANNIEFAASAKKADLLELV